MALLSSYSSSYASAYSSSYNASAQLSYQANQSQSQLDMQSLNDMAAASRAKRLDSLLGQLSGLIETATQNDADPLGEMIAQEQSIEYVLARLRGEDAPEMPDSLSAFAYELEDLIGDILTAWDALDTAGDLTEENTSSQKFKSIDGVLGILERIASRRIERMVNNHWYMQWRGIYRNPEVDLSESDFDSRSFSSLPQGASMADVQEALLLKEDLRPTQLIDFLKQAIEIKDSSGLYLLSQKKRDVLNQKLSAAKLG